jgi:hypothetical protein
MGADAVALPLRVIAAALLWPMIAVLSALLVIPFGWQAAVANAFLDVTVEATPVGSWTVHLVDVPTSADAGEHAPRLAHRIYDNPEVLKALGAWIQRRPVPQAAPPAA